MSDALSDLVIALGLMAFIEGLLYAAAPSLMRKAYAQVMELPDTVLRIGGLVAMVIGVVVVWSIRHG